MKLPIHLVACAATIASVAVSAQNRSALQFFDSTGQNKVAKVGWEGPASTGGLSVRTLGDNNGFRVSKGEASADKFVGDGSGLANLPMIGVSGLTDSLSKYSRTGHGHADTTILGSGTQSGQVYKWDANFRRGAWGTLSATVADSNGVPTGAVTSSKIRNATIMNEDISANAAIDGNKIVPSFDSSRIELWNGTDPQYRWQIYPVQSAGTNNLVSDLVFANRKQNGAYYALCRLTHLPGNPTGGMSIGSIAITSELDPTTGSESRMPYGGLSSWFGGSALNLYSSSNNDIRISPRDGSDGGTLFIKATTVIDSGNMIVTGTITANSGTWTSSDSRLKTSVFNINQGLSKVLALRGVTYALTSEGPTAARQVGFIAQEVEPIVPEVVRTDSNGYKTIAYDKLTAVTVEAIKEQQTLIDSLRTENATLRTRLDRIERALGLASSAE